MSAAWAELESENLKNAALCSHLTCSEEAKHVQYRGTPKLGITCVTRVPRDAIRSFHGLQLKHLEDFTLLRPMDFFHKV